MSDSPSPAPGLLVIYVKLLRYKNTISSLSFSICASLIFIGILNCRFPTPASNNRVCGRCWLWTVMVMGHAGGSFREWHVGDYTPTKTDIVSDEIRSPTSKWRVRNRGWEIAKGHWWRARDRWILVVVSNIFHFHPYQGK